MKHMDQQGNSSFLSFDFIALKLRNVYSRITEFPLLDFNFLSNDFNVIL
jgi:hypothetical protein